MFGERLKKEMEEIENSDPNQNNSFITAVTSIGEMAISVIYPGAKPIVDGVKPLAEKGLQEVFRKDKLTEGQKLTISSLRFLSLFFIVVAAMIGLCLIVLGFGWSFWKVTGYFIVYAITCIGSTLPNVGIVGLLNDR